MVLVCLIAMSNPAFAQKLVEKMQLSENEAQLDMTYVTPHAYLFELAGPNGYFYRTEVAPAESLTFSNLDENGKVYADGAYKLSISPLFTLSAEKQQQLRSILNEGNTVAAKAFRLENGIPEDVEVYNAHFLIQNGKFITPTAETKTSFQPSPYQWTYKQADYQAVFASVKQNNVNISPSANNLEKDNSALAEEAQVFTQDVIVQGSLCVGIDCTSGENFGFDTQRFKENNLRIHFDDSSSSASFPSNDWRIVVNDTANGGDNHFSIEDATSGRTPFRVDAGAPSNSIRVNSSGRVGIGEDIPLVELHVTEGDSPTIRLEQDGSSGFTSQTWDIAGNEANFFVRDVSNGSNIPFKIKPGAPVNALFVDANGDIGLGTQNPDAALQVESGNVYVKSGSLGVNVSPTVPLDVNGNFKVTGTSFFTGDITGILTTGATFFNSSFGTAIRIDATNQRLGIGVPAPQHQLQLSADDAVKPNGGDWTAASDRRLKKNIKSFESGLETIMKIKPVTFQYNEKSGYDTEEEHIGIIAQDMQKIAPYTVRKLYPDNNDDYLAFDGGPVKYLLVNAVQEQQKQIEAQAKEIADLKAQLEEMNEMKAQVAALAKMVAELKSEKTQQTTTATTDDEE